MNRPALGRWAIVAALVVASLLAAGPAAPQARARVWEEPLVLPTYGVEKPDPNPWFYVGRTYQGAQGRVYPYPMSDVLTNERTDKTYRAVYLENEYIKWRPPRNRRPHLVRAGQDQRVRLLLPANRHQARAHRHVGAWISGGVEWNIPHHHRPRRSCPSIRVEKDADGSRTRVGGGTRAAAPDAVHGRRNPLSRPVERGRLGRLVNRTPLRAFVPVLREPRGPRQQELPGHLPAGHAVRHAARQERVHQVAESRDGATAGSD